MSRFLAIDFDPAGLFVVAGTARGGSVRVEQAISWAEGGEGPPPLTADTAAAIGDGLRERLKSAGIAAAPVLVSVGRDKVILKEIKYPPVRASDEPALVRIQAIKEITESPDEVVLDDAPLATLTPEGERRAMVVVLRKEVFAAVQAVCAAAGLKLAGVTPRPFAVAAGLARAFASGSAPPPETPTETVAVLTSGPGGGEFTLVRNSEVVFTRAVPAQVLASEPLLTGEVRRNLAVHNGQESSHPVQAVYVAEVGSGGWNARLRTALGVPVHSFDPLDGTVPEIAPRARGRFAGAAGLLAGRAAHSLPINFASPRQPKPEANPHKQKVLLAALVAILLLGAGGLFGYMLVDAADTRLARLQSRKAQLTDTITQLEPVGKQLDAVTQWQSREVVWLDEMYDMSDRFPSGDKLKLLQFSATPIPPDKTGKQESQARLDLRISATQPQAVDLLLTSIERDNQDKKKFYVGTQKTTQQDVFTITTRVNRRNPEDYIRHPNFITPPRRLYVNLPKEEETPKEDGSTPSEDDQ